MITDREKIMAVVDNDCLKKADAAVLLEGDGYFRVEKAAELYHIGIVPRIVFSGNADNKAYGSYPYGDVKPYLIKAGIPEEALIHEDRSTQTREQAIEVVKLAVKNGWKRLALVASPEHQYRAYLTFLREIIDTGSGIALYNAPARGLDWFKDIGWGARIDRLAAEFDRIERYSAMGHLANAAEVIKYQEWKETIQDE